MGRALFAIATVLLIGCLSPVNDDLIDSLGPEAPGVEEGPTHRYGQPCLACHGKYGGEGPEMSVAGTVFATPNDDIPVANAKVILTDAAGKRVERTTNCAGNFHIESESFVPQYPMRVELECPLPDGTVRRAVMGTRVNREGSCAGCHDKGPPSPTSPGQVFCLETQPDPPFAIPTPCAGGPTPQ
jgi:hypothetical protein